MPSAPASLLLRTLRPTTLIEAPRLRSLLGIDFVIASETFQYTGSFKFRAAYHLASSVPQELIVTASSGNFGQALAYACKLLGKRCMVVMPATSAAVKVDAVRDFGGEVHLTDVRVKGRAERVAELAAEHPDAYVASAYDDDLVIEGNATLGAELCERQVPMDAVIAPIGGGGLASGLVRGLARCGSAAKVWGAEPLLANDASRSLAEGRLIANETEPLTLADGARTISLGERNWNVLREGLSGIVEVPEERIRQAVAALYRYANLKVEPTGALSVAALFTDPEPFRNLRICCVVSGGNVDPDIYRELI
jgi:threonine dehydratase